MAEARQPHEPEDASPSETGRDQLPPDRRSEIERGMAILLAIDVVVLLLQFGPALLAFGEPSLVGMAITLAVLALMWTGYQWAIVVAACYFGLGVVGSIIVGLVAAVNLGAGLVGFVLGVAAAALYGGFLYCLIYSKSLNAFFRYQRGDKSTEEPSPSDPQHATGRLTVVYTAGTLQEAHFLRNVLEDRGVRAIVTNGDLQGGAILGLWGWEWTSLPRVVVSEENAVNARQIALQFERSIAPHTEESAAARAAEEPRVGRAEHGENVVRAETLPESWPRCPQCGAPRITKCPACGTSGSGFPPADQSGDESSAEPTAAPLLLCIECDEPFTAEYAHDCEWCGHEFADGFRPSTTTDSTDFSPALLAVIGVTLAVVVGLLVYFAILLERAGVR